MSRKRTSPKITWTTLIVLGVLAAIYIYSLRQENQAQPQPLLDSQEPTLAIVLPAMPTTAPLEDISLPSNPDADFDYYILALSWSPDYCATDGSDDTQQCSIGRKLGFVLHGLWPQYEQGYPSFCSTEQLPSAEKDRYAGLFPNKSLFVHEWEKHGTCSGLSAGDYLATAKSIKESVAIPEAYQSPLEPFRVTTQQLIDDFTAVNPLLSNENLAVICSGSGRYLSELRICYAISGEPTACSAEVMKIASKSCGRADFLVRNVK